MDPQQSILTLSAVATAVAGKKINLCGQTLQTSTAMISADGGEPTLHLVLEMPGDDAKDKHAKDNCDCIACRMRRAIPARHAAAITALIIQGRCGDILLDSTCMTDKDTGFTVKLRNKVTKACSTGTGTTMGEAIGKAASTLLGEKK